MPRRQRRNPLLIGAVGCGVAVGCAVAYYFLTRRRLTDSSEAEGEAVQPKGETSLWVDGYKLNPNYLN